MKHLVKPVNFPGSQSFEETFTIVNTAKVFCHPVMNYRPSERGLEEELYRNLQRARKINLKPFRAPIMDPSWENGTLVYKFGNIPAIGLRGTDWDKIAKDFIPEKNSRLGTPEERAVLLAELLIHLIDNEGYSAEEAYKTIAVNAEKLGSFYAGCVTENAAPTGSNLVAGRYDWANTAKFIKRKDNLYYLTSSHSYTSLSYTAHEDDQICSLRYLDKIAREATPWIVTNV